MKQKLFVLNESNLDEINKLLEDGYQVGNQFHTGGGTIVFVTLVKYPQPVYNPGHTIYTPSY